MKRSRIVGVSLVAVVAAIAGCGGSDGSGVNAQEARHYVIDQMRDQTANLDGLAPLFKTLDELLPNVTYVYPDGTTKPGSDLVVVGRISSVQEGRGWYIPGEDHPSGVITDFGDKRAKWRSMHATVAVERGIGNGKSAPDELRIALPLYNVGDFEKYKAGLPALGRVVLFLDGDNDLVSYDRSLYVVGNQHSLIATVGEGGALALPFIDGARATELLAGVPTLTELEAKATLPRTVTLVPGPGGVMRP